MQQHAQSPSQIATSMATAPLQVAPAAGEASSVSLLMLPQNIQPLKSTPSSHPDILTVALKVDCSWMS